MTDQLQNQDDLTAGIFGDSEYVLPQAEPKQFRPWHKPRKQFVRREHLSNLLQRLYKEREPGEQLRYLGLPGTDLLDLRYLYKELCSANSRQMRFLGFNTEAQNGNAAEVNLNVSLHEIRRLPNIDIQSDVLMDDFRRIGIEDSMAWSRTCDLGPFDVVNIDLCDGLGSDSPQNDGSIYNALAQLMALQARYSNPWLLLITTRMGRGMFDAGVEALLMNRFRSNVRTCEGFSKACEDFLESDVNYIDPATCSETDLLTLMTTAIGKWLSALVQVHGPSRVELVNTYGYRVNPIANQEDLVSLAFRFDPVFAAAPDALSPTPPAPVDECETAKAILKRSVGRLDVDNFLERQPDLHEELIGETEQLLANARYDVNGYRTWLTS